MQFNLHALPLGFLATSAFLLTIVMATNNDYNGCFPQRLGFCFLRPDEQLVLTGGYSPGAYPTGRIAFVQVVVQVNLTCFDHL